MRGLPNGFGLPITPKPKKVGDSLEAPGPPAGCPSLRVSGARPVGCVLLSFSLFSPNLNRKVSAGPASTGKENAARSSSAAKPVDWICIRGEKLSTTAGKEKSVAYLPIATSPSLSSEDSAAPPNCAQIPLSPWTPSGVSKDKSGVKAPPGVAGGSPPVLTIRFWSPSPGMSRPILISRNIALAPGRFSTRGGTRLLASPSGGSPAWGLGDAMPSPRPHAGVEGWTALPSAVPCLILLCPVGLPGLPVRAGFFEGDGELEGDPHLEGESYLEGDRRPPRPTGLCG